MYLPAIYGGRCMVRVHCLAYPMLRIGMSKGLSGLPRALCVSGVPGARKGRNEMLFTVHARPSAKHKEAAIVGEPQPALAPFPHFSGSNNSSKRRWRRPQREQTTAHGSYPLCLPADYPAFGSLLRDIAEVTRISSTSTIVSALHRRASVPRYIS
jgi:hypothetical protein